MKAIIQRVNNAAVHVDGSLISKIDKGILVLIGISIDDIQDDVDYLIKKILNLRIFSSENGEFDKSIKDKNGEILLVSQFTLYGYCNKGNRPSFSKAMPPSLAKAFYQDFVTSFKQHYAKVKDGIFGAYMQVSLENDGPVTILLDSKD